MDKLQQIKNNQAYKQIMADSFNGVMYDVANRSKYDTTELLKLWDSMTPQEQEALGGIVKGAMHFLREV